MQKILSGNHQMDRGMDGETFKDGVAELELFSIEKQLTLLKL